jgi:hypothetical protein
MAGLVPAIHVLLALHQEGVDARHKAGHDMLLSSAGYFPACAFSAAKSASLRKLITATRLVRE